MKDLPTAKVTLNDCNLRVEWTPEIFACQGNKNERILRSVKINREVLLCVLKWLMGQRSLGCVDILMSEQNNRKKKNNNKSKIAKQKKSESKLILHICLENSRDKRYKI